MHGVLKGAIALAVAAAPALAQVHAVDFDPNTGLTGANSEQTVGWQFDVLSPITVNGLSWFDDFGNGLTLSHEVGLWDSSGALLATATIPAGTAAPLDGLWRYVSITPVNLAPGQGYIIGGYNGSGHADRLAFDVTQTVIPEIRFIDATYADINAGFVRPTLFSGAVNGFYGPSFTLIPAPGAAAVLLVSGLAAARRRR